MQRRIERVAREHSRQASASSWKTTGARGAMLSLLWLALNGADGKSWLVGGPVVIAATWFSLRLKPALHSCLSPLNTIRFAWFFGIESLKGGWDVARRALSLRLALNPSVIDFHPRIPAGAGKIFFCNCVSLLPGTCTLAVEENLIRVHVLDASRSPEHGLKLLEERVAAMFLLKLPTKEEAGS